MLHIVVEVRMQWWENGSKGIVLQHSESGYNAAMISNQYCTCFLQDIHSEYTTGVITHVMIIRFVDWWFK